MAPGTDKTGNANYGIWLPGKNHDHRVAHATIAQLWRSAAGSGSLAESGELTVSSCPTGSRSGSTPGHRR